MSSKKEEASVTQKARRSLVPALRFPEFRDAGEWEEGKIYSLFKVDKKPEKASKFDSEKIITVKLHANGVVKNERAGTLTGGANYYKRRANEFIFSKIDLLNGAFGLVPDDLDGFCSSSDVPAFAFKEDSIPLFFLDWLKVNYQNLPIERTGTSSTLKRVAPSKFLELPIQLPSKVEQQKIADCLSSIDDLITLEARKIEALKAHKKGLMQQLFPAEGEKIPKLRFPEFRDAGEWEKKTIGSVCRIFSGGTPVTSRRSFYGGDIPFIRSAEIDKTRTELFLTQEGLDNSAAKLVVKGDLLLALYGANSGDVAMAKVDGAINQAILCLRSECSNAFIYHSLSHMQSEIVFSYVQGGQGNLSGDIVKSIELYFPSQNEQQKIADCLSSIDDLISLQARKLEALNAHKKGLMQQLFPVSNEVRR
ncbi:MAG: restriction endonuclease subunit S [Synergistota bacterium]|nr:restriction endonuclease subunit S [Synergistota bacterium]